MTIAEVSKMYNLSADTLRYYERIGLIPTVGRTKSGIRNYTESDCMWIEFVKCMRNSGMPIDTLIEYFELFQKGDSTIEERKQLLVDQKKILEDKIMEMQSTVNRLSGKIENYENKMVNIEKSHLIR